MIRQLRNCTVMLGNRVQICTKHARNRYFLYYKVDNYVVYALCAYVNFTNKFMCYLLIINKLLRYLIRCIWINCNKIYLFTYIYRSIKNEIWKQSLRLHISSIISVKWYLALYFYNILALEVVKDKSIKTISMR